MTIRYQLLVKGASPKLEETLLEEYCCYGALAEKIVKTTPTDYGYKSSRRWPAKNFRGIKLHLQHDTPYGQHTNVYQRRAYQNLFRDLGFYEWLGMGPTKNKGEWFESTRDTFGNIDSFTFLPGCPTFLMVAATGIWRLFSNSPYLYNVYDSLLRHHDLTPHIAFIGALQISSANCADTMMKISQRDFKVCHLSTHMPWAFWTFDVRCASRLMQLRHKDFLELPSMMDEQKETKGLAYVGRDAWFGGISKKPSCEYLTAEKWAKEHCLPSKERWEPKTITGESLINWLTKLQSDATLLFGKDLHGTPDETQAYINAARKRGKKA